MSTKCIVVLHPTSYRRISDMIRYDTSCYFVHAPKPTRVSLIYHTEPTTNKWKTEKLKSKKTDTLRSIGRQSGESM